MNFDANILPSRVRLTDDNGVMLGRGVCRVRSKNPKTPNVYYRCDIADWICDCPDYQMGKCYRRRRDAGFVRTFAGACEHLRIASCALGIIYVLADSVAENKTKKLR